MMFTLRDVCNPDEIGAYMPENGKPSYNPYHVHPFILHDHGFVITVVFAGNLQDALDEAVDRNKLDGYLIQEDGNTPGTIGLPAEDYPTLGTENEEGIVRLGNASEPFDIETLDIHEMSNESFYSQLLDAEITV